MFDLLCSGLLVFVLNQPAWEAKLSAPGELGVTAQDVHARFGHIPVPVCEYHSKTNDKYREVVKEIVRAGRDPEDNLLEWRLYLWNEGEELRGYAWHHLKFALDPTVTPSVRTYHANKLKGKLSTLSNLYGYDLWAYGHMPCPVAD